MTPKISIVTAAYNAERYIADTIDSVTSQSYRNYEYIVVDGASSDATMDIVRERADGIDHIVSEPDDGISDAMNKGLELVTGEYVLFLHADDYLVGPSALEDAAPLLAEPIEAFRLFHEQEDGELVAPRMPREGWLTNFKWGLYHQSVLCRTSLLRDLGGFDTSLRVSMDYDLFLRAYRQGVRAGIHDLPLSVMRRTGISSQRDRAALRERFREEKLIHERYAGNLGRRAIYTAYWIAYPIYRGFNPWRDFRG
ncbi:MAG: glycosyltransferase family 2 protein [Acidimicrobiia bacterium]|nr:glycosyltransferase family 2 protein [Acidimicrobiia bacterium]